MKISDPGKRQERVGPLYEGRELHLGNIDWTATEEDVSQVFSKYGKVEKVRIPRDVGGKSRGFGFVVFSNNVCYFSSLLLWGVLILEQEEATAALDMNLKKLKSRQLYVSISTTDHAKRQATTIITPSSRSSASPSPSLPSINGNTDDAALSSTSTKAPKPSYQEIQSRTVALLNVPDTINDARIRALAEPYGALVKVVLRPDHQGATIEYQDVASAGKAALGLEGHEIAPGRLLGVGTVKEMLQQKEEMRSDRISVNSSKKSNDNANHFPVHAPIRRPNQPGARRGGRGGLGLKKGAGLNGPKSAGNVRGNGLGKDTEVNGGTDAGKPKSNAEFKAMFL